HRERSSRCVCGGGRGVLERVRRSAATALAESMTDPPNQRVKAGVDTEVLIVGAGPTGLMLANQLGRRGVRAQIIDRHDGPALPTRALGVQPRTLEIYAHLGIDKKAIEMGRKALGADMWARGKRAAHVPFDAIGMDLSPFPFLLILGQDDNEKLMGEALRRWN